MRLSPRLAVCLLAGIAIILPTLGCTSRTTDYVLVYLKTGPQSAAKPAEERQKIFQGHMTNIQRLADEKKLVIAGPFDHPHDAAWRGIFIMNVASIDDARRLTDTDPGVQAQVFTPEFKPFRASKTLGDTLELERRRAATQPASDADPGISAYLMLTATDGRRASNALHRAGLDYSIVWCGSVRGSPRGGVFVLMAENAEAITGPLARAQADCGPYTVDRWWSSAALPGLSGDAKRWR